MKPPPIENNFPFDLSKLKFLFRRIGSAIVVILVVVGLLSAFYTVNPESEAVISRLGRYHDIAKPGLHFKLPFGIDKIAIVPVKRQLKMEFGYGSLNATNPYQYSDENEQRLESDMVTGDLNAAVVEWVVQYSISSPRDFLYSFRNPEATFRDLTENAMCQVIGDRTVDEVLTSGRTEIEISCLKSLKETMTKLNMGISVEQIQLKNVHPPAPVQRSFEEVNRAQQEREQLINEANGEYNRIIPRAKGLANQRITAAEGFAIQRINEAEGNVTRFKELLIQYDKAPAITKQRLYLETMNEVLPKLGSKIIIDEDAKQFLPLLNLK